MATKREIKRKVKTFVISWAVALFVYILKFTCRLRVHNDPRKHILQSGGNYVYAILHAHQVPSIMYAERGAAAMVSRNFDGQFVIPAMKLRGIVPIRGSGMRKGKASKGGLAALEALVAHVAGGRTACIAVDGPAGPRGCVHKGVVALSMRTGAAVVPLVAVTSRKWTLIKAWDRLQIPKPFSRIDGYFGDPMYAQDDETSEQFRERIENKLIELESQFDPSEARYLYRTLNESKADHLDKIAA